MTFKIFHGDCLDTLKRAPANSMDSIVTDPPYGLSFMGKKWDYDVPTVEIWKECLRVLKPGGHLLAFGGTRTYHRLVIAIEDAGFEIRDQIQWLYGQGFPKSQNLAKAAGDESLAGLGTALKPANEPICLARKPLSESTIAKNVIKYRTGGLNIDAGRIEADDDLKPVFSGAKGSKQAEYGDGTVFGNSDKYESVVSPLGRFPSNVILDEDAAQVLDEQAAQSVSRFFYQAKASKSDRNSGLKGFIAWESLDQSLVDQTVSLSAQLRATLGGMTLPLSDTEWSTSLFGNSTTDLSPMGLTSTTSTASKTTTASTILNALVSLTTSESIQAVIKTMLGAGLNLAESVANTKTLSQSSTNEKTASRLAAVHAVLLSLLPIKDAGKTGNFHATVKPIKLMEYLIKLVTPEGGIVLDPFMGSGTTGVAALRNGFQFRGIEREENYFNICQSRLDKETV